jgi:hypothetical protein
MKKGKRKLSEGEYRKIIDKLLQKGYSANKIQKYLQKKGIGIRRQKLLKIVKEERKKLKLKPSKGGRPRKRRKKRVKVEVKKPRVRRKKPKKKRKEKWHINIRVWTLKFSRGKKKRHRTVTIDMRLGCYAKRDVISKLDRKMEILYYQYDFHRLRPWELTKASEFREVSDREAESGTKYPFAEFRLTSSDGYFDEDYIVRVDVV